MATINFFVEQINFKIKNKGVIRQWILDSVRNEKKGVGEINYVFCSDEFLLNINRTYLNHNTLTDIITFPVESFSKSTLQRVKSSHISGEIYISIERVNENAKEFGTEPINELNRVLIHGVLHLCGYADKSALDVKKMRQKEEFYLKRI